jgi:hypothetical protein
MTDYGHTTKALLHNQRHTYERKISALEDELFVLNAKLAVQQRIIEFAEEKGLLDQWQENPG